MTQFDIRLFENDAAIIRVGEGLLACELSREEWTHEAHLAACLWLLRERPAIDAAIELPGIIARFNVSVGGVNDDSQGYHETITQFFLSAIRVFLHHREPAEALVDAVNALLQSPFGRRDFPLQFYSTERLFSVEARRKFIAPNVRALSELGTFG